jgi:hypothetical protein
VTPFLERGSLFHALGRGGPVLGGTSKQRVAMGVCTSLGLCTVT